MSAVVVALSGDIDLAVREATSAALADAVASACATGADVVVDLSGVTFLDSTGLSCLMLASRALGPDHAFHLSHPPQMVRRVLEIAGLGWMIHDFPE